MLLAVFGVSLVVADGVLTPAQSVLGAIQGIRVADESITTATIIGVSCTILVLLFAVQPLGVHRVSSAFAPIVILWLLFNAVFGIYNLIQHDHTVLKAFSPYFAGAWLMRNKTEGWKSLGGVLLCFTGVECLFADMGAFSRRAVQLSWLCLAYPCLMLAYIGQAAHLVDDPSGYSNPFFNTVPPGMFWPSLVLAILAAVVASQATITACFQLIAQIMNSSYFPQIQMHYTSDKYHGQVYIPIANWLLMIGCVVVTAVFNNVSLLTLLLPTRSQNASHPETTLSNSHNPNRPPLSVTPTGCASFWSPSSPPTWSPWSPSSSGVCTRPWSSSSGFPLSCSTACTSHPPSSKSPTEPGSLSCSPPASQHFSSSGVMVKKHNGSVKPKTTRRDYLLSLFLPVLLLPRRRRRRSLLDLDTREKGNG